MANLPLHNSQFLPTSGGGTQITDQPKARTVPRGGDIEREQVTLGGLLTGHDHEGGGLSHFGRPWGETKISKPGNGQQRP